MPSPASASSSSRRYGVGRPFARRRHTTPMNEINVTPFVDVMLVLLIIFMVTAPLLTVGVEVDLPKTKAGALQGDVEPLAVSIDKDGVIYVQETPVELTVLIPRLRAITTANPDTLIYVRGDTDIAYGRVMEIIGLINAAGFTRVGLVNQAPIKAKKP